MTLKESSAPPVDGESIVTLPAKLRAVCSGCGAKATCDCNVAYVPAAVYARKVIAANPDKSNRTIASRAGVSLDTVNRVRKEMAGERDRSPEKRVGKDGKHYPKTQKTKKTAKSKASKHVEFDVTNPMHRVMLEDGIVGVEGPEEQWEVNARMFLAEIMVRRAYWNKEFKGWQRFEKSPALLALVREADEAWSTLCKEMLHE